MRISVWSSDVCSSDLRDRLDLAGLDQRQQFERLVESAEAAGKDTHRAGAEQKVHLAQGEIVELKAQRRGDIAIRRLFVRQRSEEHTSELQSLMRNSYAVFCLKNKNYQNKA